MAPYSCMGTRAWLVVAWDPLHGDFSSPGHLVMLTWFVYYIIIYWVYIVSMYLLSFLLSQDKTPTNLHNLFPLPSSPSAYRTPLVSMKIKKKNHVTKQSSADFTTFSSQLFYLSSSFFMYKLVRNNQYSLPFLYLLLLRLLVVLPFITLLKLPY